MNKRIRKKKQKQQRQQLLRELPLVFHALGNTSSDLEWLEAMQYTARCIANVYAISPQLLGDIEHY